MGLDVGDKRIGIAFSDALRITAQGYETYTRQSESEDVAHIKELFLQQNAESIVCGLPKNMNGTIGPQAEKVRAFAALVEEATGTEIIFSDERLTTVFAERALLEADVSRKKRRKVIDKLAAVTILQGYLDSLK
ncbi:Holliday junction resolvase RuvX [Christensenellaceae bacterium NSJ-63]|uniref:Putative pre-16S rRNA nuclease n=2 Tax=Guopingia tenuis TaxID=2763656 RepID=A0A926DGJ0_9FIRM|nr:Holliday junction resolvase RuvX [Guopingia tenuis]MBC8537736.1 Holliday junction resolvase RuvX [Guopingia tenuis]MBS5645630.1 Holliday junction resolvase RuvX [Clostridiales bacterium]